jgi:antitoxin component YwqK of YwqJK toxin-antitoxin module
MAQAKRKTCSRGHTYTGSGPCLVCWPGGAKKKHTHYHKDGTLWAKGFMLDSKMHGKWEWFRKDGSKMRSGSFVRGKQSGTWTTYDKTGKVVKITKF